MDKNIKINEDENCILISVNPEIYPLDVIYSAAYVFLEKAYLLLEGDPKKEIIIKLTAKERINKEELKKIGKEFLNELISYGFYKKQSEKNNLIRQIILQRVLLTGAGENNDDCNSLMEETEEEDYLDDPKGIAIPWEEKYGDKKNGNSDK